MRFFGYASNYYKRAVIFQGFKLVLCLKKRTSQYKADYVYNNKYI